MLDIRLLGPPEVLVDGKPIDVDTRKAIALLAYLAVQNSAQRETVAAMFWYESPADRSRASLRRTLSSLKSGAGDSTILADRNQITLTGPLTVDLTLFDDEVAATSSHDHHPSDVCNRCIPYLERASHLYRGDFLEGFSVRDAPDFEDWVRNIAETYRLKAGDTFNRLAMAQAAIGDYNAAITAVARWIDLDELHEPAHRLLMLLHAWAGDRPKAIEAYREFVALLDRELGVEPLDETTELYEAILDEDLPPAPGMRRRVKTDAVVPTPSELIDRTEELRRLQALVDRSSHAGVVAVIVGGPWMGKTRLLEELATAANGRTVLHGRSYRTEQSLPFGVMAQVLTQAAPLLTSLTEEVPHWAVQELTRIVPTLSPGERPMEPDAQGELRLMEAMHLLMTTMARHHPILMLLDDVQWMDTASATAFAYLARRLNSEPMCLLLTQRAGDPVDEQIASVLDGVEKVRLGPLTADDVSEHTNAADAVIASTGGVPLLVSEALSGHDEAEGINRYIDLRLKTVSDLGRQVLTTAAVLSGSCDVALLRATSGRTEDEVVAAVEELIACGLLREVPASDVLNFTLDALETVTYDSLTLARKRLLHRRAAEALAERPRARIDARLAAATATQFERAGDARAADWFATAGDRARDAYANEEAFSFYRSALALGAQDPGLLHLALGELHMRSGDYVGAMRDLNAAAGQTADEVLCLVEHRLGEVHRLVGRFSIAREHYERAETGHPRLSELYSDWALLEHRLGNADATQALATRALEAAQTESDPDARARVHNVIGVVSPDPGVAIGHLDRALDLADGNEVVLMAALNNKAHVLNEIGNQEAAIRLVDRAIDIAARTGHRHREAALHNLAADLYHRSGQERRSEEAQLAAMRMFAEVGTEVLEPEVWLLSRW